MGPRTGMNAVAKVKYPNLHREWNLGRPVRRLSAILTEPSRLHTHKNVILLKAFVTEFRIPSVIKTRGVVSEMKHADFVWIAHNTASLR